MGKGSQMRADGEVTSLLRRLETRDADRRKSVYDRLIPLLYNDLRKHARQQLGRERGGRTLQPTALVHEAYQRLIDYEMAFESREHFLNVAAAAMRRLLVEAARRKNAAKRWGHQACVPLDDTVLETFGADPVSLIALDEALAALTPEQARLVELRYFLGLSVDETAAAMQVNPEALKKRWRVNKVLLYERLGGVPGSAT